MGSPWLSRLAVATAAAGALTLSAATSAWAAATIPINDAQVPTTAAAFGGGDDCTGPLADLPDNVDGWHFILPAASGDSFVSLTLTFTKQGGGTETVTIDSTDPDNPSEDPGGEWTGYIDNAGNSGDDKHAYLVTAAGWTLTDGSASVTGSQGVKAQFNLSHTCAGTPTSPRPSNSVPPSGSLPPSNGNGGPPGGGGGLPITGAPMGSILVVGIGLLAAGVALMAVRRRRGISELTEM